MKKLEFKTSKGDFLLIDMVGEESAMYLTSLILDDDTSIEVLGKFKYMTEEQFDKVLDRSFQTGLFAHYVTNIPVNTYCYNSGLESFESLIKSLGCNLFENPELRFSPYDPRSKTGRHEWHEKDVVELKWKQAESKTFYKPILLKKL